jgi:ATP-dependent Zn protease
VLVVLFLLSLQSVLFSQHVESLAYSDFQALLHAGKVKEVLIGDDSLSGTVDLRGAEAVLPAQAAKSLPNQEVHKLLTAAQERVHETLKARQAELGALAQALLSHEVVDRATLLGILSAHGSQASVVADSQNTQEAVRLARSRAQS